MRVEIDNVLSLVAAIVGQANLDSARTTAEFPRTCLATAKEHSAKDCADQFLNYMEPFKRTEDEFDPIDYCFGVVAKWQQ